MDGRTADLKKETRTMSGRAALDKYVAKRALPP